MIAIREEVSGDLVARETLLDAAFGAARFEKTCERLREGRLPVRGLSLVAAGADGRLVGTLRFWHAVAASGHAALLLGPLAVDGACRSAGIGGALVRAGLAAARERGHGAVLLVGDEPSYRRFGFTRSLAEGLDLPGGYDPQRFLGLELEPGALAGARGMIRPSGAIALRPGAVTAGLPSARGAESIGRAADGAGFSRASA